MARAGGVIHPTEWQQYGYNEITQRPRRGGFIDRKMLRMVLGISDADDLAEVYKQVVSNAMKDAPSGRRPMWTGNIALGGDDYVRDTKKTLAAMAIGREIVPTNSAYTPKKHSFHKGFILAPKTTI
ncbi:MAG: hypothetical protein RBT20_07770 [Syntrophales bacterium]|jgi:hypothetical protein|nr:hypothetical protein [Syntrophales bacterium]